MLYRSELSCPHALAERWASNSPVSERHSNSAPFATVDITLAVATPCQLESLKRSLGDLNGKSTLLAAPRHISIRWSAGRSIVPGEHNPALLQVTCKEADKCRGSTEANSGSMVVWWYAQQEAHIHIAPGPGCRVPSPGSCQPAVAVRGRSHCGEAPGTRRTARPGLRSCKQLG